MASDLSFDKFRMEIATLKKNNATKQIQKGK